MSVRPYAGRDATELQRLAAALFRSSEHYDFADEHVFVWPIDAKRLGGFVSVSVRAWSEGAHRAPVPHIEGWYVESALRRRGIGAALMDRAESWCRAAGFVEICSDAETANRISLAAHQEIGFEPTLRLQYFRKQLV